MKDLLSTTQTNIMSAGALVTLTFALFCSFPNLYCNKQQLNRGRERQRCHESILLQKCLCSDSREQLPAKDSSVNYSWEDCVCFLILSARLTFYLQQTECLSGFLKELIYQLFMTPSTQKMLSHNRRSTGVLQLSGSNRSLQRCLWVFKMQLITYDVLDKTAQISEKENENAL